MFFFLITVNILQEIVRHPLLFVFIFILTVIIVFTICYKSILSGSSNLLKHGKAMDSLHLLESQSLQPPASQHNFPSTSTSSSSSTTICMNSLLEELSFEELVGRGKYGQVWRGQLQNGTSTPTTVAIKVVSEANKRYLVNECRIYSLHRIFAEESSMARYYGYTERLAEDGKREYCMAIEYGHLGSLYAYLHQQTLDWTALCRLLKSLAQGLAYLHTEQATGSYERGGKKKIPKPCIVHRDLCSRNVIVKADGSCMIVDHQFAVPFLNNKPLFLDSEFSTVEHGHRGGQSSVVGTLRYLAPELLDGAINLNDAESALKQADVYALGLIFWEVASRCTDLYQGIDVPSYQAPFQLETASGSNGELQPVTFDQMRVLISRNKARPLFPDIWKDSNPAIRLLKETITECWDQEPEARLTALCIKERLADLPSLWRKFKSETASCCVVSSLQQLKSIQNTLNGHSCSAKADAHAGCSSTAGHHHLKSSSSSTVLNDSLSESSSYPSSSTCYINKFENSLHYKHNGHHHLLHHPYHKHHFYQINLTAAGGSGGSNNGNSKKMDLNSNVEKNMHANLAATNAAHGSLNVSQMLLPKVTLPLQPHQARNLCIERNLMLDTSDEHDGLLEQGLKFQNKSYMKSNISTGDDQVDHQRSEGHEGNEEGQSGGHRHNHHHQAHYPENRTPLIRPSLPLPISYVQNETSGSSEHVKTKETNKLQNRNEHLSRSSRQMSFSKSVSSTSSIFEYIKQKFNLTSHLNKCVREKQSSSKHNSPTGAANSQRNGLLEEWKENVGPDENLETAAVRIGTLLYAKDSAMSTALEYSNQSVNVHQSVTSSSSSNVLVGALVSSQSIGNLPPPAAAASASASHTVDNNSSSIGLQQLSNLSAQTNSSPLISAPSECDLSSSIDILSNMDKLAQLSTTTNISMSTSNPNNNSTLMGNNANKSCILQNNNRIESSLASIFLATGGKPLHTTSELTVDESQLLH